MLGLFRQGPASPAPKYATPDSLLAGRVVVNGVRIAAQLTPPYLRAISLHNECHYLAGQTQVGRRPWRR